MKVVILAGGFGTRLSEETQNIPKPMVRIGDKPILLHIMNWYAKFGYNEFIIAAGYKSEVIKEYFYNFASHNNDFQVNLLNGEVTQLNVKTPDWKVSVIDTGLNTMTGGRVKRLEKYIGNSSFMLTYGDGLSDVNLKSLLEKHKNSNAYLTLTSVRPTARFGEILTTTEGKITSFKEKPQLDQGEISGGFFVCEPEIFQMIDDDNTIFEKEPMERIVNSGKMYAYKHAGFWQSMDTLREKQLLDSIWTKGDAPWA